MKITKTFTDGSTEVTFHDQNTFNIICYADPGKVMHEVHIEPHVNRPLPQKFRKRPVVVEALQWTGDNVEELIAFVNDPLVLDRDSLSIKTLEGNMKININDWVIRGIKGEYYPCKPDIFAETYE